MLVPVLPADASGQTSQDVALGRQLADRVHLGLPVGDAEIRSAEGLASRHPDQEPFRNLFEAILLTGAKQDAAARRFDSAMARLRRAQQIRPDDPSPSLLLANVLTEIGDWGGAEAAARQALALAPRNLDAFRTLAWALFRQDKNREAVEVLQAALEIRDVSWAKDLLDRIRKQSADERGMTEEQLSHFHVRYDGEEHAEVGHEILRALERHYATLAITFDYQPKEPIPVILFSREAYYTASGAPAWSGGVYDNTDGRIRIPIGGLDRSLTPDIDRTLIHELTHAFIADITHGTCPRDIHEGMAQYMEGKRLDKMLSTAQIKALAEGRIGGVYGFYLSALSFVEYLMGLRGQGGMNDLLRIMGETGSVDEAFRQVHGHDYRATRQAWWTRLRQQYAAD